MHKKRRIVHPKSNNPYRRKRPTASRILFRASLLLCMVVVGCAIYFNQLTNTPQSGTDTPTHSLALTESESTESKDTEFTETDSASESDEDQTDTTASENQELPVAEAPAEPELTRMTGTIKNGDTPSSLLEGHLEMAEINALCAESKGVYSLSKLKAGRPWTMVYSENSLVGLEYEIDQNERLVVSMTENGYVFRREPIPYERDRKTISGSITQSLFGAVQEAGEEDDLAIKLAEIFAWDIDFVRDLRSGDSFKVIVDKRSRDGRAYGYEPILAASFTNGGETYYAFRYKNRRGESSYYDQSGRPLRKPFLKAPLPFTRISSGYSMSRMHPILHYARPHQGIDYSAPTGTPISTVADGVIADVGFNGSQGKYVRVVHSNGFETIYNHMSKYARSSKKGTRVQQGDVIGYVGMTGYATGPHLDYRMKLNGALVNPLSIKSMPVDPIPAKELPAFSAAIASFKKELISLDSAALTPSRQIIHP